MASLYIVSRKERSFMFADKSQMFHITYCSSLCEEGKERKCEREIWRLLLCIITSACILDK